MIGTTLIRRSKRVCRTRDDNWRIICRVVLGSSSNFFLSRRFRPIWIRREWIKWVVLVPLFGVVVSVLRLTGVRVIQIRVNISHTVKIFRRWRHIVHKVRRNPTEVVIPNVVWRRRVGSVALVVGILTFFACAFPFWMLDSARVTKCTGANAVISIPAVPVFFFTDFITRLELRFFRHMLFFVNPSFEFIFKWQDLRAFVSPVPVPPLVASEIVKHKNGVRDAHNDEVGSYNVFKFFPDITTDKQLDDQCYTLH